MKQFLSDHLTRLSGLLADFEHEPRVLEPSDARTLRQVITGLRIEARKMENELSRHRWNEQARRDRAALPVIGGNVVAFPDRSPAFSDGRGEPREWR